MINRTKPYQATRPDPTCKEEVRLIADYLAGALRPPVLAAFERHLDQCRDCTAFVNTYRKTIEATKSFLKSPSFKIWPTPLGRQLKGPGSVVTLMFCLHLFICNAYLMNVNCSYF